MAIAIGDVVEVTIQYEIFNQINLTILHYKVSNVPTEQDPLASEADLITLLQDGGAYDLLTPAAACIATNCTITKLSTQYIWPVRYVRDFAGKAINGTGVGQTQTCNSAVFVEKLSAFAGKKNRGGIHMPAPPDGNKTLGKVDVGYITNLSTFATACMQRVLETGGTGAWSPVILHRTKPLNGTAANWEAFNIQDTIRAQRRRTVGVGQ